MDGITLYVLHTHDGYSQAPSVWKTGQNSWNDRYIAVTFFTLMTARTLPATTSSWYSTGCNRSWESFATWHNACAHAGHVSTISCNNIVDQQNGTQFFCVCFHLVDNKTTFRRLQALLLYMRLTAMSETSFLPKTLRVVLFHILTVFASPTPD